MRTIVLDGKVWQWKEVRRLRRLQIAEARRKTQLQLFELRDDTRPPSQKTVRGRYESPLLFKD